MKKRKQGERQPFGYTKRKILLLVLDRYPKDIEEPELRDILREEDQILEAKGVRNHLSDMEKENVIEKQSMGLGKPNIWKAKIGVERFKKIAEMFLDSQDKFEFIKTPYVQSVINKELVDILSEPWVKILEEHEGRKEDLKKYRPEGGLACLRRYTFMQEKDIIEILKTSPTALKTFCFEYDKFKDNDDLESRFNTYMLSTFLNDLLIGGIPKGRGLYADIKLKYVEPYEEDGEIKERNFFTLPDGAMSVFRTKDTKVNLEWMRDMSEETKEKLKEMGMKLEEE